MEIGSIFKNAVKALTEEKGFCIVRASVTRPSSRGLGHCPFTAATGVRIPVGVPKFLKNAPAFCRGVFCFQTACRCENIFKLVYNNAILNLNERKQC